MYCPRCGAEYQEGFTRCRDCGVDLVARVADAVSETVEEALDLVTVFKTSQPETLALARSILEEMGIEFLVHNEGLHDLFPVAGFEVHLEVRRADEARALELLSVIL